MRRLALTAVLLAAVPEVARASPRAMTTEDLLEVRRADVLPHGTFSSRLSTDYGERLDRRNRAAQAGAMLTRALVSDATFAVGLFDHLQLEAALPLVLLQQGTLAANDGGDAAPLRGAGLGDVPFGAAATFLALPARGVGLGAAFDVIAPTATVPRATYERGWRFLPQLLFSAQGGRFEFHATAGYLARPRATVGRVVVDDAVTYGLGARVPLGPRRLAAFLGEALGEIAVRRAGASTVKIRASFEVRTRAGPVLVFGAYAAPLLAPGQASVGATFAVGYTPPHRVGRSRAFEGTERIPTGALIARHRAFVPAKEGDPAPRLARAETADADGDGLRDEADRCPHVAEDRDGFEDGDGCPDGDDDRDGIADAHDRCPREPEVRNGFEDDDGCPDVRFAGGGRTLPRFDPDFALPALVFEAERADAHPALRAQVERLAEILRLNPWIERLEIEVRVQDTAAPPRLARLADLRARLIVHLLERAGVDPARVVVRPPRSVPAGHPVRVRLTVARPAEADAAGAARAVAVAGPRGAAP